MLVLAILIVIVGQMVISAAHNRTVAENATGDLRNSYGVRAGYEQAKLHLLADYERGTELDSVNELWAKPQAILLGPTAVGVLMQDAGSRINLAQLVNDKGEANTALLAVLRRLLVTLNHPAEIADRILDYQDTDTSGDFEAGARNARMSTLDELDRIDGLTREVLYGDDSHRALRPFVTIWPQLAAAPASGLINVNTAPEEILTALDDEVTPQLAAAIVAHRTRRSADGEWQHFKNVQELSQVDGMSSQLLTRITPRLTVVAPAFEIRVRSETGAVVKQWLYVVTRAAGQQGGVSMSLVAQQRETEAKAIKPPRDE